MVPACRAVLGTFDGQGHTIFAMEAYNTGSYAALFGCCVDARIEDLTVCGSAAGEARASYAAGLVSYAKGCEIEDINVYVDVTAAGTHAGGVAAYICDGTAMQSCFSHGSVSGKSGVGGIVGLCYSASDTITGCANFGAVTGAGHRCVRHRRHRRAARGVMTKCANYGAVGGADRYTGGLRRLHHGPEQNDHRLPAKNEAAVSSSNTETRAATSAIVGNAQNLIWGGCTAAAAVCHSSAGRQGLEKTAAETCPDYTAREAPQDGTCLKLHRHLPRQRRDRGRGDRQKGRPDGKRRAPQPRGLYAAWPAFTPTGRDMTSPPSTARTSSPAAGSESPAPSLHPWLASGGIHHREAGWT